MENLKLQKKTMRRVYAVYVLKNILNPLAVKVYALAVFAVWASIYVSAGNVFANAKNISGFSGAFDFSLSAITQTEFVVQAIVLAVVILVAFLIRDIAKNIIQTNIAHI